MPSDFATPVSELGASVMRNLRNARASFNGGAPVDCIFRNRQQLATLGVAGLFAREPMLNCLATDVQYVEQGQAVQVDCPAAIAPFYTVAQLEPVDLHTGWRTVMLEPAT